ncbi:MAG: cytochrome P450 [Acidimicrobiales bacterium]
MTTELYENEHDDEPLPAAGYRTYEVYQRERVGETTNLLKPRELVSDEMLTDPYRLLSILRENYPCYRDWVGNRFWTTRYDDVTSVFTDDANFETRSKRWFYGAPHLGRNLWDEIDLQWAYVNAVDVGIDEVVSRILDNLGSGGDLATAMAARLPLELWIRALDLPAEDAPRFAACYWRMQRGYGWKSELQRDGLAAFEELVDYFTPIVSERSGGDGADVISTLSRLEFGDEPPTATDLVATLLEADHETLHGGLSNMWFLLLTHQEQLATVRSDPRLIKFAWLEALRHSPPVMSALRFARHEVERFGRLIPTGGLVECSAGAANRDPRAFMDPDEFVVERKDLCQREPRGQYRADGLPSGIAFGLGPPSIHPAVPKERPRSMYAMTRDVAVSTSQALLDRYPHITLQDGASPHLRSLRLGEMRTCWELPISY